MAKLLNPAVPERFVPPDQAARAPAAQIAYLLRVPTKYDRPAYDRAVRAQGAVYHSETAMLDCLLEILFSKGFEPDVDAVGCVLHKRRVDTFGLVVNDRVGP